MVRSSTFAAALAASALLVMSSSAALANAPAPLPITGVSESAPPSGDAATVPSAPTPPPPNAPPGDAVTVPAPPPPAGEQVSSATSTQSTTATTATTASPPPSSGGEGITPGEPEGQPPAAVSPAEEAEIVRATGTQADAPATEHGTGLVAASSEPGAPSLVPSGDARPAPTGAESGVLLERLLPRVERRLRGVQTQMDDLQRRLAVGAPPSNSLVRLRRSLELIAPALAALGARVDSGGPMSPDLRQLLQRVNRRLDGAHVTAGALAAALRRSGARGPELAALLRELEGFGADGPLFSSPGPLAQSPTLYATSGAYTYAPATPAAPSEPVQRAAPPQREIVLHHSAASHQSPAPDELVRQVAASGSASAGPGGAFSAAGVGALAALLGGLVLPRLLTRVQLMGARSYKAAFLVPLQRPG